MKKVLITIIFVFFQRFDIETVNKTSSRPIFSKFISQLFGSNEIINTNW